MEYLLFSLVESLNIIGFSDDIFVKEGDVEPKTMTCSVDIRECTKPSNPWFYKDGKPVVNAEGITVTKEFIGRGGVVQWKLNFTNLSRSDVFGTYICDVLGTSTSTAVFTTATTGECSMCMHQSLCNHH